ncbi:MAG: hypothetical protein P8049_11350, partial [Gemmatimonadota bacterium]
MRFEHERPVADRGPLTDLDLHLFNEGTHFRIWEKLGCHAGSRAGKAGFWFAVWAPDARTVSVVG